MRKPIFLFALLLFALVCFAQKAPNLVYVDKAGVLRYTKDKTEAAFFGVNYTVPFAYGFRSHQALGVNLEKAIDADVHHMARLGLDAFRVHVWDVDISDSLGNLLNNEHLRLFDYLLHRLKAYRIKTLITPIAFWGNGYPERDVRTAGFSYLFGKEGAVVKEEAFAAQENYLKQFFTHVNPYTGLAYKDDPDVIAMEINNEPKHSGPGERATEYVNRMAAAVRSTGWNKPVFYNISESPAYAGAVVKAKVDGYSFQWYPTGLVAGRELKGNFLPHVDAYTIPFADTVPAFRNRARMVYEFDAGDLMQPVMYPAMARSFRTAGFQWATQFAYDPMATAYANTEYQTHYLNLVYTPAKAISLLIASRAFHRLPRGKGWGSYPADTLFDVFRVSYKEQLSEMNSEEEFYYSNNTSTQPKNLAKLKHIAGVGSSPVVKYAGSGAYFLDKLEDDVWRLEVMPDVLSAKDPFEKASPKKQVVQVHGRLNEMQVNLPGLRAGFAITSKNSRATAGPSITFVVSPGVYYLHNDPVDEDRLKAEKFFAPSGMATEPTVVHHPLADVSSGTGFPIVATVAGTDTADRIFVEMRPAAGRWRNLPMQQTGAMGYRTEVPADLVSTGVLNYRIMVKKAGGETYTFPGGFRGDPYAWDNDQNETYQSFVAAPDSPLELFNATTDRDRVVLYNPDWRRNTATAVSTALPKTLAFKTTLNSGAGDGVMGWQFYFGDRLAGRKTELASFTKLVVRARSAEKAGAKFSLITTGADAYAVTVPLTAEWQDLVIPLAQLQKDSFLLLPRPYPSFLPLQFLSAGNKAFDISEAERLEASFRGDGQNAVRVEVQSVWLQR